MGHRVGIICDVRPAGKAAEATLLNLNGNICELGVVRAGMSRQVGLNDLTACRAVRRMARDTQAHILHGHGAKGGAYARLAAHKLKRSGQEICAFYTPHGGSLHYSPESLQGRIFMGLERRLGRKTDGLIFESAYSAEVYKTKVGDFPCEARIIPNGLRPQDFYELVLDESAADFVFVGELRHLKGVDILLHALAELNQKQPVTAYIAGGGPDAEKFKTLAHKLKLVDTVTFAGPIPAGTAFTRGRCLIVPSRAESFPYIVLEVAAARLPVIASHVGGIPEIVEGSNIPLIPADDIAALTQEMQNFLDSPQTFTERATILQKNVSQRYRVDGMARAITDFYDSSLSEDTQQ
jgi:glycosyltransferase involved in cell wall biosynthesis